MSVERTLVGRTLARREETRFLGGRGEFLDDVVLSGTLHVEIIRCPHPHARVLSVDASRARSLAGVAGVFAHGDIVSRCDAIASPGTASDRSTLLPRPALADGVARFAGEAVAAVVARDRGLAVDAAGLVDVRYEPLEFVLDANAALHVRAPAVQGAGTSNLAYEQRVHWGDVDAVFQAADRVVRQRWVRERCHAVPLEPRGAVAQWHEGTGELVLWTSTQTPHEVRAHVAAALRLEETSVRVIVPDVGSAFGSKLGASAEELLVGALALALEPHPVKWVESRRESFVAGPHGRGSNTEIELALREDGKLLGLRLTRWEDAGAYLSAHSSRSLSQGESERVSNNRAAAGGGPSAGGARRPSGAEEGVRATDEGARTPGEAGYQPKAGRHRGLARSEREARDGGVAAGGRCGGGLSSPTSKETQRLSDFCSGSELTGAYGILAGKIEIRGVLTNKAPTLELRSTGLADTACVLERAIDVAASELELDPVEVRRHNLVDSSPGDASALTSGSLILTQTLDKLVEVSRYSSLRAEQARRRQAGELVGLGVALNPGRAVVSPKGAAENSWEAATVRIGADGSVEVLAGAAAGGQGHETTLAAIASQVLGVTSKSVRVKRVDTAALRLGAGTLGAQFTVLAGSAVYQAARQVERKLRAVAARLLRVSEDYVERQENEFVAGGRSTRYHDVCRAAHTAATGASTVSPGLEETVIFEDRGMEPAMGAHLCAVCVDGETGSVAIERYIAVEDIGRVIRPGVVDGLIRGAITQGLNLALAEALHYDQDGQQLTTSLLDYAIPRSSMAPKIEIHLLETPATSNPLGVRGLGDGQLIAALAATVNAVLDAFAPLGVRHLDPPLGPEKLWRAMAASLARRPA